MIPDHAADLRRMSKRNAYQPPWDQRKDLFANASLRHQLEQ